jgi:hypothetical protein
VVYSNVVQAGEPSWTQERLNFLSDLIAVGTVLAVETWPEATSPRERDNRALHTVELTILVSQIFKGEFPSSGGTIAVYYRISPEAASEIKQPLTGDCYLMYLKNGADGRFQLTSEGAQTRAAIRRFQSPPAFAACESPVSSGLPAEDLLAPSAALAV